MLNENQVMIVQLPFGLKIIIRSDAKHAVIGRGASKVLLNRFQIDFTSQSYILDITTSDQERVVITGTVTKDLYKIIESKK